jgi:hypothetical protein
LDELGDVGSDLLPLLCLQLGDLFLDLRVDLVDSLLKTLVLHCVSEGHFEEEWKMWTYLAIVPVAHLVLENLLFLRLESLADAQPATTDSATDVTDAAFIGEPAGNALVGVALLLEVNDASIVGIVVCLDWLRPGGLASGDTNVAQISEASALVGLVFILLEELRLAGQK